MSSVSTASVGTLSSLGIGSGLDVNGIISKLVALEQAPLTTLVAKAANETAQLTELGNIKSQVTTLNTTSKQISDPTTWVATKSSSSNTAAATISSTATANPQSFTLNVDQLAQAQSLTSSSYAPGSTVGSGTLTIQLGSWAQPTGGGAAALASANAALTAANATLASASTAATNAGNALTAATTAQSSAQTALNTSITNLAAATTASTTATGTLSGATGSMFLANNSANSGLVDDPNQAAALATLASSNPSATAYSSAFGAWANAVTTGASSSAIASAFSAMQAARNALNATDPATMAQANTITASTAPADQATNAPLLAAASSALATFNTASANASAASSALVTATDAHTTALGALGTANSNLNSATSANATAQAALASATSAQVAAQAAVTAAGSGTPTFTAANGSTAINVSVAATDSLATIASNINAANAGVTASIFNDGTNQRLVITSNNTGAANGFRIQVADSDGTNNDNTGLSNLAFNPAVASNGFASSGVTTTYAQDAKVRINGVVTTSTTNTFANNIAGVTININATTTTGYGTASQADSPVVMSVIADTSGAITNVQNFVSAYNTLNKTLEADLAYDAASKTAGLFQADPTVLGIQNALRNAINSVARTTGGAYKSLEDIGLTVQTDGSISVDSTKLSMAASNGTQLQQLFTQSNSLASTNGFALKFASLAQGMLNVGGSVYNENHFLQTELDANSKEQQQVNDRAASLKTQLTSTYSALDSKMASLNALSAYVTQQVTLWNKNTSTTG